MKVLGNGSNIMGYKTIAGAGATASQTSSFTYGINPTIITEEYVWQRLYLQLDTMNTGAMLYFAACANSCAPFAISNTQFLCTAPDPWTIKQFDTSETVFVEELPMASKNYLDKLYAINPDNPTYYIISKKEYYSYPTAFDSDLPEILEKTNLLKNISVQPQLFFENPTLTLNTGKQIPLVTASTVVSDPKKFDNAQPGTYPIVIKCNGCPELSEDSHQFYIKNTTFGWQKILAVIDNKNTSISTSVMIPANKQMDGVALVTSALNTTMDKYYLSYLVGSPTTHYMLSISNRATYSSLPDITKLSSANRQHAFVCNNELYVIADVDRIITPISMDIVDIVIPEKTAADLPIDNSDITANLEIKYTHGSDTTVKTVKFPVHNVSLQTITEPGTYTFTIGTYDDPNCPAITKEITRTIAGTTTYNWQKLYFGDEVETESPQAYTKDFYTRLGCIAGFCNQSEEGIIWFASGSINDICSATADQLELFPDRAPTASDLGKLFIDTTTRDIYTVTTSAVITEDMISSTFIGPAITTYPVSSLPTEEQLAGYFIATIAGYGSSDIYAFLISNIPLTTGTYTLQYKNILDYLGMGEATITITES